LKPFFNSIPDHFSPFPLADSALGSVTAAGLAALVGRGRHLVTIDYGALPFVEPTPKNETLTDSEPIFHKPRSPAWPSLGAECGLQGIGVTLFLAPSRFVDIASISIVANTTGGSVFFSIPDLNKSEMEVFKGQLKRVLKRMQGYDFVMRVRCSKGLQIKYYGDFQFQNQSYLELAFGVLNSDEVISVSLSHTQKLDPRGHAFLQSAVYDCGG